MSGHTDHSCWHTHNWPGLAMCCSQSLCALAFRDTQVLSHPGLALRNPLMFLASKPLCILTGWSSWSLLAVTHLCTRTHSSCWHHRHMDPQTAVWSQLLHSHPDMHVCIQNRKPSPRKESERNLIRRQETTLIRAQPDKHTDQQANYLHLAFFITLHLNFPPLVPPQIT